MLLIPEWSQSTLSQEQIRLNNGIVPPPQPILPTEFIIQLYNPDQQVVVKWNGGSWSQAPFWGFEMPQQSFRQPSVSAIDRVQSDPTASENTPKLGFRWKKDGKLSKDYICVLSDKSTDPDGGKKKSKEADITISIFKHFKELTIYEPNLSRVEVEDPKGLEVVLLLGAIVIREVFNSSMAEAFNISDPPSVTSTSTHKHRLHSQVPPHPPWNSTNDPRPPPTDPRTQWELDQESARLRKQVEREERERRRAEEAETKRVKRLVEEEERHRREKQKQVDRETERLKKIYGKQQQQAQSPRPQGQAVTAYPPAPIQRPHSAAAAPYIAHNLRPPPQPQGQYLQPQGPYLQPPGPGMASSSSFFGGRPTQSQQAPPKKSSFWHFGKKEEPPSRLTKQRSVVF